jgi:hypothetical protein
VLGITPSIGDMISGHIIYDTNAVDTNASPFAGVFFGGEASLSLNGTVITSSSSPQQGTTLFQSSFDFLDGVANVGQPISVNGVPTNDGYFNLMFWFENLPVDDTLPNPFPTLRSFDPLKLQIIQPSSNSVIFSNTLTSVSSSQVSAVPEPSSLALFGIGACVAGIGAACRRRREKHREATA